jgi:hypothetical protein
MCFTKSLNCAPRDMAALADLVSAADAAHVRRMMPP